MQISFRYILAKESDTVEHHTKSPYKAPKRKHPASPTTLFASSSPFTSHTSHSTLHVRCTRPMHHTTRCHNPGGTNPRYPTPTPRIVPIRCIISIPSCRYSPAHLLLVNAISPVIMITNTPVLCKPEPHSIEIKLPCSQNQKQCKHALREDVQDSVEHRLRVNLDPVTTF